MSMMIGPPRCPISPPGVRSGYGGGVPQVGRKLAGSEDGRTLREVPGGGTIEENVLFDKLAELRLPIIQLLL